VQYNREDVSDAAQRHARVMPDGMDISDEVSVENIQCNVHQQHQGEERDVEAIHRLE
jgi:hypothetical protein